jgi:hypothetical protein
VYAVFGVFYSGFKAGGPQMTHIRKGLLFVACAASLAACSGMSDRDQRTLSGGAIGAGVGTVGAAVIGAPLVAGAAVGAVGGAVIGNVTTH